MSLLIIPIGFSGSGKTTYYNSIKTKYKNLYYISKDLLRLKLSKIKNPQKAISDQSNNKTVAFIANKMLWNALKNEFPHIYYDCMNINIYYIQKILKNFEDISIKIILFMDSLNPELRKLRIEKDLKNGKIRADTLNIINNDEIKKFNNTYNQVMKFLKYKNVKIYERRRIRNKYKNIRIK